MSLFRKTLAIISLAALFFCCPSSLWAFYNPVVVQESNTMLQHIITNNPKLANLIAKSGLTPVLSGNGDYTFLAPSEESLKVLENESAQRIRTVLSGHILKGKYQESDLKDGANLETLAGTKVVICRKKKYTLVDGVPITSANHQVKNGLVHNIGGIIKI